MAFFPISVSSAAPPTRLYSPGVRVGDVIYTSGIVAIDEAGQTVGVGDVRAQTRHVFEQIRVIVESAGGRLSDVFMNQIFLKDFADYGAMNEVYREYFPQNPPARYCVGAALVRPEWLIEVVSAASL